mgnify:CR=1
MDVAETVIASEKNVVVISTAKTIGILLVIMYLWLKLSKDVVNNWCTYVAILLLHGIHLKLSPVINSVVTGEETNIEKRLSSK